MILIGLIAGNKPAFEGANYTFLQGSFGSLITVGICATAFMGLPLTLADYRDKKILKHFFVTPVSPVVILLVQVILSTIISVVSSVVVSLIAVFAFQYQMEGSILKFIVVYFLVMISMLSLGMVVASICKSIKMANLVCSIVYFPMLFLSGATIPYEIFPKALQKVANVLPLTQGIKLLKGFSLGVPIDSLVPSMIVIISITIIGTIISIAAFRWE
jgi:ABC-2 type transport system permease protein